MSAKKRPVIIRWLPAILLGALIAELLYLLLVWREVCNWYWYAAITLLFIGALLGYDITRDTLGVYNALRAGRWFRVLFWAVFGGLVGGILGLLAKYITPHDFAATMPESPFLTWLLWMAIGVAFGLMGVGQDHRQIDKAKP